VTSPNDSARLKELPGELEAFRSEFASLVQGAADAIAGATSHQDAKQASVHWKTRMIDRIQTSLSQDDPVLALLDAWTVCVRMRRYLGEGEGAELFHDQQDQAVRTADQCLRLIEDLAAKYIAQGEMPAARTQIQEHARQHPMTGVFQEPAAKPVTDKHAALRPLMSILSLPLAPLTTPHQIGRGVDSVLSLSRSMNSIGTVVKDTPGEVRSQAERLLSSVEENKMVESLLVVAERVSKAAETFAQVADTLPDTVDQNKSAQSLIASVDRLSKSAETFATVAQTLPEVVDANKSAQSLLASVDRLATASHNLSATVQDMPQTLDDNRSAQRVIESADRLSKASENLSHTADKALEQAPSLIDLVFRRTAQLLILVFALVAALVIVVRVTRPKAPPAQPG